MKKMANGEPLGPPGRPGKGSYLERLQNEGKVPRGCWRVLRVSMFLSWFMWHLCVLKNHFRHISYPLSLTCWLFSAVCLSRFSVYVHISWFHISFTYTKDYESTFILIHIYRFVMLWWCCAKVHGPVIRIALSIMLDYKKNDEQCRGIWTLRHDLPRNCFRYTGHWCICIMSYVYIYLLYWKEAIKMTIYSTV